MKLLSIIIWLLFINFTISADLSYIYQSESMHVFDEDSATGYLNIGLCVSSGKEYSYFLVSSYEISDKMSFLKDEILRLDAKLFHKNSEYKLAVYKTKKIDVINCTFADPILTEPVTVIVQILEEDEDLDFQFKWKTIPNVKIHKIIDDFDSNAQEIKTLEIEYYQHDAPFGGAIVLNTNKNIVGFLPSIKNRKDKKYIYGPTGDTIKKYLRSIKYDFDPPAAPNRLTVNL